MDSANLIAHDPQWHSPCLSFSLVSFSLFLSVLTQPLVHHTLYTAAYMRFGCGVCLLEPLIDDHCVVPVTGAVEARSAFEVVFRVVVKASTCMDGGEARIWFLVCKRWLEKCNK